jgi:hypothetical protein
MSKAQLKVKEQSTKSSKAKAKVVKLDEVRKTKGKDLTPLEKARAARAKNKETEAKGAKPSKTKKAKSGRYVPQLFKAPEDFKPHFLEVLVKTEKDGLLSNVIKATRYQGRYDPEAADKKKADLGSYDPATLTGIHSRLSMTTFATNATKRLPVNTTFKILLRINRKSKDGSISVGFKQIWIAAKNAKGRMVAKELDKKDPNYRKFRKANRIMPAAFKNVLMPPKKVRGVAKKAADDGDE